MTDNTPSPVAETVDTRTEVVERAIRDVLARHYDDGCCGEYVAGRRCPACPHRKLMALVDAARALAAERDAAVARAAGWREAFDRSTALRAGDASERRHLIAEMTKRGLLSVLQEIDHEWLAQSAAHAETHHAPDLAADRCTEMTERDGAQAVSLYAGGEGHGVSIWG